MQSKERSSQSQNACLVHFLGRIRNSGHQKGKVADVSVHLVPPVFLHHVTILPTVTETDNSCSELVSTWN
jgi:hypothetical protein